MSRIKRFSPKIMHTIENFIENGVSNLRELTIKRGKVLCNKDFQVIEEIEEKFLIPFFDYGYSRFGKIEQFQISFIGFSQQQMDELIDLLARLTYLESLDLSNNHLTQLSPKIGEIKGLKCLYLYSNLLFFLPDSIENLSTLREIYLHNNLFFTFPNPLLKLQNLKIITLHNNSIQEIPEQIVNMKNLRFLTIFSNPLMSLPDAFGSMKFLEYSPIKATNLRMLRESSQISFAKHLYLQYTKNKLIFNRFFRRFLSR